MAMDQKALESLTGPQQIIVMESLKQEAAAWLLGVNVRTLRQHSGEFKRQADDKYDARDVVATGLSTGLLKVAPVELSPDELETCIRAAEFLGFEVSPAVMRLIATLEEKYGDRGLAALVRLMREIWTDDFGINEVDLPWPSEADLRELIQTELQSRYKGSAAKRLNRGVVCEVCGKVRRGRGWVTTKAKADEHFFQGFCPTCHQLQQQQHGRRKKPRPDNVAALAAALMDDDE